LKSAFFIVGLVVTCSLSRSAERTENLLTVLAETGARSTTPDARHRSMDAYLRTLEHLAPLPPDESLHYAWAGFMLAENDMERTRVLSVAATIPDARARMLIGAFRDFPDLRKHYVEADRAHSVLIAKPGDLSGPKRPLREIYGLNPFDAPYSEDRWTDPHGVTGRWQGDGLTVDVLAYPAGNFLGLLHQTDGTPRRLWGILREGALCLNGADVRGTLKDDRLTMRTAGRDHTLGRRPVGVTQFEQRPAGARVLLDATTGLRHFRHAKGEAGWKLLPGGIMEIEPSKGSLFTKDAFGDLHGYLEFRHAYNSESTGPRRGNSGLYLFNTYEVQIIDSFGLPPTETSEGSIYHIAAPRITASAAPLEWQSFEFKFRAPRFDAAGNKTANARLTLWQNGMLIHDDLEIPNPTAGSAAGGRALKDPVPPQPFMLQSHGALIQFRNIWVLPFSPNS